MSRKGPVMHNAKAYYSHVQNISTWVVVEYHNELSENSKSSYSFVWVPEKSVQELLSKFVLDIRPIQVQLLQTEIRWGYVSSAQ